MRRQAGIGALLLVCVGVVLGATVFRSNIAQATGLKQSQSVIVDNTPAQAVPVQEQNLDGSGNVKVHEQGTATVAVSGYPVATRVDRHSYVGVPVGQERTDDFDSIDASTIVLNSVRGDEEFNFLLTGAWKLIVQVEEGQTVTIPLGEPLIVNELLVRCEPSSTASCIWNSNIVGS